MRRLHILFFRQIILQMSFPAVSLILPICVPLDLTRFWRGWMSCKTFILSLIFLIHDFCRRANFPGMGRCHVRFCVLVPEYIPGGSCRIATTGYSWRYPLSICLEGCLLSVIH